MPSQPPVDPVNELIVLVRSRLYLVAIDTPDPARGYEAAALAASQLNHPIFTWTRTKGIRKRGEPIAVYGTTVFKEALTHIEQAHTPAIWYFESVGKDLEDATNVQALRDTMEFLRDTDGLIVLAEGSSILPESLKNEAAVLRLPTPTKADYVAAINRVMLRLQARVKVKSTLSQQDTDRLVAALGGFTISEAERMIIKVALDDGTLAPGDIATVINAKHEQLKSRGLLEFCNVDVTLADVVGLSSLKEWLAMRRAVVADPLGAAAAGLPFPKGMLLVGVPGCGKSMCAKAVASDWGLPLLRMDTSGLFDKYVGESEKRFLAALDVAQRAAPCILWIDEIEKAFSSGNDSDGGVSLRVLGTFLSWLQDRKGDVFVVATANNIDRLPPEAVRKGRFDEIFFVDLPGPALRESIFRSHIGKRAKSGNQFDSAALAQRAEGFSGAEIEQAVVSAAYAAFAKKQPLDQAGILAEIERTVPLSRTMPERVRDIRSWANGRAAPAGS